MIKITRLVWDNAQGTRLWSALDNTSDEEWSYQNALVWQKPNGDCIFVHYHKQDYMSHYEEIRFCQFEDAAVEEIDGKLFVGQEIMFDVESLTHIRPWQIPTTTYRHMYHYLSNLWKEDHDGNREQE